MKVLMSGGGTAGHIYPALSVAAHLAAARDDVTFVGTPDGLEARLVPEAGVRFRGLKARGFDRARPWTLLTAAATAASSAARAWNWLGAERPDVVVGFGGYVSIPVGLAAVARRIPLVLHEQNSVPGLANRVLSRWARCVGVTYEESAELLKHPERAVLTGNPVREAVLSSSRAAGRAELHLGDDDLVLLIFGGSRGARHLNTAVVDARARLLAIPELKVVHVAGPAEVSAVRAALGPDEGPRWRVYDYLPRMGDAIAACDLALCRAGATTIAELTVLGAPAVVVPYPYATDDHQTKNAATLVAHGAAVLVADSELDDLAFVDGVVSLLRDPAARATMSAASRTLGRADAAERVVALARAAAANVSARVPETEEGPQ